MLHRLFTPSCAHAWGGANSRRIYVSPQRNVAAFTHHAGREENQDGFIVRCRRDKTFIAVADGIKGSPAGEIASRLALRTTYRSWREGYPLDVAVQLANLEVLVQAQRHPEWQWMGSTVVAAEITGDQAAIVSCGDSRAYRRTRNGEISLLTRDSNYASLHFGSEALKAGGQPFAFPLSEPGAYYEYVRQYKDKNLLFNFIGTIEMFAGIAEPFKLEKGELLLLTSDGLALLPYDDFAAVFTQAITPEEMVGGLFQKGNDYMQYLADWDLLGDNLVMVAYVHL